MNAIDFLKFGNSLTNGIKDAVIGKWRSHDDHEEVILTDREGNRYEIKYFPKQNK